jgi:RsiW-degrading membrane proteinase PrsW (M82 family)
MSPGRDPVERAADEERDLQEVSTWEPRTALDRAATAIHGSVRPLAWLAAVSVAGFLSLGLFAGGLSPAVTDPTLRVLVVLSAVPALLLAAYVWAADVTTEPAGLLAATFFLGLLFAPVAGLVNAGVAGRLLALDVAVETGIASVPYFFLVVGVGEESVKLLAVWLYAFRDDRFDAVVDGAVYGAVAGLGFALLENALYIVGQAGGPDAGAGGLLAAASVRALAGPGHVIYSGIAGYYLGLAKFNREHAGPLVVKGLLVAATLHGTYNVLVGAVPGWAVAALGASAPVAVVGFVVAYDGLAGYVLYRKLRRYRRVHDAVYAERARNERRSPDRTEFDP